MTIQEQIMQRAILAQKLNDQERGNPFALVLAIAVAVFLFAWRVEAAMTPFYKDPSFYVCAALFLFAAAAALLAVW